MKNVVFALRTFFRLALPYFRSEDRWRACGLLVGIIGSELFVVYIAVKAAEWMGAFFNAIEARNWEAAQWQLVTFALITLGAILSGMGQYWFGQTLIIRWREWMTKRYVDLWMAEGRQYRVRFVDQSVDNIHLRIANDVFVFIRLTHELGTGFFNAVTSLIWFAIVLWGIGAMAPLPLFGVDLSFSFPGWLIVLAIIFAGSGTLVAHLVGKPLIPLQFMQQRYESDFRFAIARAQDHAEAVALIGGEKVERNELKRRYGALLANWVALVRRQNMLNGFIFGYYHVSTVFPTLVMAPAYLVGAIPIGVLVQATAAFKRFEEAFAFCLTKYATIAEWKAVMDRVSQFETAMTTVDAPGPQGSRIAIAREGSGLVIEGLTARAAGGAPIMSVPSLALAPGERALVRGPSGAGKSTLGRAIAGIWPMGEGHIRLPSNARVLALPQRVYFPLGTLRQVLTYPTPAAEADDADVRSAMAAVGLSHLADRLDDEAEWNTLLSGGEQQRLGFARALIHRPDVLLLDEPVSTLEDTEAHALYALLAERLPGAIVISIGRTAALADLHQRVVEMTSAPAANRRPALAPMPA